MFGDARNPYLSHVWKFLGCVWTLRVKWHPVALAWRCSILSFTTCFRTLERNFSRIGRQERARIGYESSQDTNEEEKEKCVVCVLCVVCCVCHVMYCCLV